MSNLSAYFMPDSLGGCVEISFGASVIDRILTHCAPGQELPAERVDALAASRMRELFARHDREAL